MKLIKILFISFFCFFALSLISVDCWGQNDSLSKHTYTNEELKEKFPAIEKIEHRSKGKNYDFNYTAKNSIACTPNNILTDYKELIGLRSCDSLALREFKKYRDKPNAKYDGAYNYDYFFKGILVKGGGMRLNMYKKKVKKLVIGMQAPPEEMSIVPSISHEKAKEIALNARFVKNKKLGGDPTNKKGELFLSRENCLKTDSFKLIYQFTFLVIEPVLHPRTLYINAHTGKVELNTSLSLHAN